MAWYPYFKSPSNLRSSTRESTITTTKTNRNLRAQADRSKFLRDISIKMSNRKPLSGTIVVVVSDLMDKAWIPPSNFLPRIWIDNKLKTKRNRNLVVLTYTFLVDPTAQSWFVTMSFHTSGSWCIVILNVQFQNQSFLLGHTDTIQ